MRYSLAGLLLSLCAATSSVAAVHVDIGINLGAYPRLVAVPGYPVYYAPSLNANYFFYDGLYWVFQGDNWYESRWYNGPWSVVEPDYVPLYVLRVPVRYYRRPPVYFRSWRAYESPRWGEHWGRDWQQRHDGWNHWERRSAPRAAPLPTYQRQYSAQRYPQAEQQSQLHSQNYHYQPREAIVQQRYQQQTQAAPAREERGQGKGRHNRD